LDKDFSLLRSLDGRIYTLEERWQLLEQVGNLSMNPNVLIRRIIRTNKILLIDTKNEKIVDEIEIEISDKSIKINDIVEDLSTINIVI